MKYEAYIVNSFTENLAEGNPAGVVLCNNVLPDKLYKKIAIDIGKSETAFISKKDSNTYRIRWFSPKKEMPICGHATLAAAKVIFNNTDMTSVDFIYASGTSRVTRDFSDTITISFPLDDYDTVAPHDLFTCFFPEITVIDRIIGRSTKKVVLIISDDIQIQSILPDFRLMENSRGIFDNGIAISKKSDCYDFESRYFNPWAGVNEDPITGSVHTVLGRYWGERLHKSRMTAAQLSQRPGLLELNIKNDKIEIAGKAKIVFAGFLYL